MRTLYLNDIDAESSLQKGLGELDIVHPAEYVPDNADVRLAERENGAHCTQLLPDQTICPIVGDRTDDDFKISLEFA